MSALQTHARLLLAQPPVVSLEATQTRVQRALRAFEEADKLHTLLVDAGEWTSPAFAAAEDAAQDARWAFQDALADLVGVPINRLTRPLS